MTKPDDLPRQLARTLGHLQRTWDLQYVPAGTARDIPDVAVHTPASPRAPAVAAVSTPRSPGAVDTKVVAKVDTKQALRAQAQAWSPAVKLEYLKRKNVGDCKRCPLSRSRTNIVFGVGAAEARIMFVGEAPGADEDRQGEPFVGRAGQRLTQWIEQLGLSRGDVYIANVLKCRPPGNRDPRPEETQKCSPFLQAQIRAIMPTVIVALGRHAGQLLSRRDDMTLRSMRGSKLAYDAGKGTDGQPLRIPLLVTYHPSWVLRQEGGGRGPDPDAIVLGDLNNAMTIAYPDRRS